MRYSVTDKEKERDIDSYGVMFLVVMSASAACQVGMVHQSVLDRVAMAPSLLFRPLVPSSSCSPSHPLSLLVLLSPFLLLLSSSVWSHFSSLPCGGSGSRFALFDKHPHFHEEVQRVVGADNQVHGGHGGGWHDVSSIAAWSTPKGADKLWWLNLVCDGA